MNFFKPAVFTLALFAANSTWADSVHLNAAQLLDLVNGISALDSCKDAAGKPCSFSKETREALARDFLKLRPEIQVLQDTLQHVRQQLVTEGKLDPNATSGAGIEELNKRTSEVMTQGGHDYDLAKIIMQDLRVGDNQIPFAVLYNLQPILNEPSQ